MSRSDRSMYPKKCYEYGHKILVDDWKLHEPSGTWYAKCPRCKQLVTDQTKERQVS